MRKWFKRRLEVTAHLSALLRYCPNVSCAWTIKPVCVMEAWPYCVMAVSIDQLQQLALKLLQGRLEGDGQSVQGEGQHLEQLRPQQSISW